jgi:2-keto-3-deoxy-L-arabinonate dehydratase
VKPRFRGILPVVPTTFNEDGMLDLVSPCHCVDFMIDAGSDGLLDIAQRLDPLVLRWDR